MAEQETAAGAPAQGTGMRPADRLWRRGALTAFVARHRRTWDAVMTALAIIYLALAIRNDDHPGAVSPFGLVALSSIFVVEFAARCWDAPSRRAYLRAHWLDAVSCIPLVGGLRAVRVLRLLRLGTGARVVAGVEHEMKRGQRTRQSFWYLAPCLLLLWAASSYGIWAIEHDRNPGIRSFGDAMYWSAVTATTVGYGDIRPLTPAGRVLAGGLAFLGLGLLSFASARLTALWLQPEQEEEEAASRAIMRQLEALRAEMGDLRRSLAEHDARPSDGRTGHLDRHEHESVALAGRRPPTVEEQTAHSRLDRRK